MSLPRPNWPLIGVVVFGVSFWFGMLVLILW